VLILAAVAQRWRLVSPEGSPAPAPVPGLLTRPPDSLRMRAERRDPSHPNG
jgi:hypothetical protein